MVSDMFKRCVDCNNRVDFWEFYITGLFSNFIKFTCPKCGAKYKVAKLTVLIYFFIASMPMMILMKLNERGITVLWLIISILVLQPLIYKYKKI